MRKEGTVGLTLRESYEERGGSRVVQLRGFVEREGAVEPHTGGEGPIKEERVVESRT